MVIAPHLAKDCDRYIIQLLKVVDRVQLSAQSQDCQNISVTLYQNFDFKKKFIRLWHWKIAKLLCSFCSTYPNLHILDYITSTQISSNKILKTWLVSRSLTSQKGEILSTSLSITNAKSLIPQSSVVPQTMKYSTRGVLEVFFRNQ